MSCQNIGRDIDDPNILKLIARPINIGWKSSNFMIIMFRIQLYNFATWTPQNIIIFLFGQIAPLAKRLTTTYNFKLYRKLVRFVIWICYSCTNSLFTVDLWSPITWELWVALKKNKHFWHPWGKSNHLMFESGICALWDFDHCKILCDHFESPDLKTNR